MNPSQILKIRPTQFKEMYYLILGTIYRYKGTVNLDFELAKQAEVIIDADGKVLKNRGNVDLEVLAFAILLKNKQDLRNEPPRTVFIGITGISFVEVTQDPSKQYIKLEELTGQFNLNKSVRV